MNDLSYAEQLDLIHRATAPATDTLMGRLAFPTGSRGLDAGCGSGLHTVRLARLVGPEGGVTGLDRDPGNLDAARRRIGAESGEIALELVDGDLLSLPFADGSFDWVWCADVLWIGAGFDDPAPVLTEMRRVLRPGGTLALVYWSGQRLLPGHPALEARLDEAFAAVIPYLAGVAPEHHSMNALSWLRRSGFTETGADTAVAELQGPLTTRLKDSLTGIFAMLWEELQEHLPPPDRADYERLCRAGSPECLADDPDYYGYVTYTAFHGRRTVP